MAATATLDLKDRTLDRVVDKVLKEERLTFEDGVRLMESKDLESVGYLANVVRERKNGIKAYFIRNQHFDPTNICEYNCMFCSWKRDPGEEGAYVLSADDIIEKMKPYKNRPISEIHMVAGVHPDLPYEYYLETLQTVKSQRPDCMIQAYTAVEIFYFSRLFNRSIEQVLLDFKAAGLDALPGGGAEVFAERVRQKICRDKADWSQWSEVHRVAHRLGIPTNATLMYGHIETSGERIDHLLRLRGLQDETAGFKCFVPMPFHNDNNPLTKLGTIKADDAENLKMLAVARLMLDNFDHIRAFWVMITPAVAQRSLSYGVDDMDGTVLEETIIHEAGADTDEEMTAEELIRLIREAGRIPVERDTVYREIRTY